MVEHLIPAGVGSAGKDDGPSNNPIEPAALHKGFLGILVLIGAAEQELEEDGLESTELRATVTGTEPCDANQPSYAGFFHGVDHDLGRFGK